MLTSLEQGNVKKYKKVTELLNIDEENLHIFWTTGGILIKIWGKIWLMILLKGTRKHGFILSPEDTFFEKLMEEVKLTPSAFLGFTFKDLETSLKVF